MEDGQLSFEMLARETMDMSFSLTDQQFSFEENFKDREQLVADEPSVKPLPEGPGVVYRLEKGISTFCVRGFSSENISESFEEIEEGDAELFKILKLEGLDNLTEVGFFPTENIELAEIICDELINRRFPRQEDILCNLSDPGFSWWLDLSSDHFQVFFKSYGIHRAENYIRLGPLGDPTIAEERMRKSESIFRMAFPVGEFVSTDKGFSISTTDSENSNFIMLKNFFHIGENSTTPEVFPSTNDGKTLYYYFKELAAIRSFWLELESLMTD